jgi:two-component system chemotaxis sensor kinase CheA
MMDQHRQTFKEEAYELLAELELSLLELEESPEDMETVGRVFRAMHTIKGSGAMFGFDDIASFTHEVETVFDLVRNGRMAVSRNLINLTLGARDQIRDMLDADGSGESWDHEKGAALITALRELVPGSIPDAPPAPARKEKAKGAPAASLTYRIRFRPARDTFLRGGNPVALIAELAELGECRTVAQMCDLPVLSELDPELVYIYWDMILTTSQGLDAIRDVFIFVEDESELHIEQIDDGQNRENEYKKLGEILIERGDLAPEEMEAVLNSQKRLGQLLVERGLVAPDKIESALLEQQRVKELRQERQNQEASASIRIPSEKLDALVNLVGELVTVQARLSQTAASRDDAELLAISEEVERLTAELRDTTLNVRMLPIGSTFSKFKRLVRDLSGELGKEIELSTEGGETELDKTVIEKLNDPLVHIIRNCIDHGIEQPHVRTAAGKTRHGTVHLGAVHSGDSVLITIRDDGAGLNRAAIRAKAEERGLIPPHVELSDREVHALIFAPGFSTARQLTSVSGRGVGMDVVKKAIDALRGSIDVASEPGAGTVITLKIPLTLAIIESLLVKIGDSRFVLPLSQVEECIELTRDDVAASHGRTIINVRGHVTPYIPLRQQFSIGGEPPDIEQIVITRMNGSRVGFVVDHVIGEHQTVIKSLGRAYKGVEGVSGATILGDGSVALILDTQYLAHAVEMEERAA